MMSSITTLVLAGGMSRRMGQDKARIVVLEFPLLTQICLIGLSVSHHVYVVAGVDRNYSDIMPNGCELMIDRVVDGPIVALSNAMTNLISQRPNGVNDDWVLVLACDLPMLSSQAVRTWVERLPELPDGTIAYLPRSEKGWEPLCGFYHLSAVHSLELFVASGQRSFQQWLLQESVAPFVRELEWDDRQVFLNCNTMSSLDQIRSSRYQIDFIVQHEGPNDRNGREDITNLES